jgi:RNA polymerase sigma factor (sigma-70 family)
MNLASLATAIQLPTQLPRVWATQGALATMRPLEAATYHLKKRLPPTHPAGNLHQMPTRQTVPEAPPALPAEETISTYAFYRKHTERMLRRYLYASMQVGRSPQLLGENVGKGWVSSRKVTTFEDALIFVLDIERCINRLNPLDRKIISRVILQEYTYAETAAILGLSSRTINNRLPQAIDNLTEALVTADLLMLPN